MCSPEDRKSPVATGKGSFIMSNGQTEVTIPMGSPRKLWATEVAGDVKVGDVVCVQTASGKSWMTNVTVVLEQFRNATGIVTVVLTENKRA